MWNQRGRRQRARNLSTALTILVALSACAFDGTFFRIEGQGPFTAGETAGEFSFLSRDGNQIHGLHLLSGEEPQATIYLFHGSGENIYGWKEIAEPLTAAGYDVFMMDYRGFGVSQGSPTHMNVVADAEEMVRFVETRVRTSIRLLMGQSYGGQVAIKLAHEYPDDFHGLIVEGTFTSHRDEVMASIPVWLKPIIGLVAVSPYEAKSLIGQVADPVLIIHSRDDRLVPFWMGQALYESTAGRAEFWQTDGPHALAMLEYPELYVAKVNDLLAAARAAQVN